MSPTHPIEYPVKSANTRLREWILGRFDVFDESNPAEVKQLTDSHAFRKVEHHFDEYPAALQDWLSRLRRTTTEYAVLDSEVRSSRERAVAEAAERVSSEMGKAIHEAQVRAEQEVAAIRASYAPLIANAKSSVPAFSFSDPEPGHEFIAPEVIQRIKQARTEIATLFKTETWDPIFKQIEESHPTGARLPSELHHKG